MSDTPRTLAALQTGRMAPVNLHNLCGELEREHVAMREVLGECFRHLGGEIHRKTLNGSARDGTQALSRKVAELLDGLKS